MGEVKSFRARGQFPKHSLIELGQNPDLLDVQIVCHWKGDKNYPGGYTTVGWTSGLTHSTMMFGARHLMLKTDQVTLGAGDDDSS